MPRNSVGQRRQVVGVEVGVGGALALGVLRPVERFLEGVGRHVHHDLAEHLDEPAVGVAGEPHVAAGLFGQPLQRLLVEAQVQDGVHHAGHRELRSGADAHQQRVAGIAEPLAHGGLERLHVRLDLVRQAVREPIGIEVGQARLGADREPVRDRQAHVRHLGEVGPLATQQVLHVLVAFREVVDVLGHCMPPAGSSGSEPSVYGEVGTHRRKTGRVM